MTGYQLYDKKNENLLGSVIFISEPDEQVDSLAELEEAWEATNNASSQDLDEFIEWFNERYISQIERLYLEFI